MAKSISIYTPAVVAAMVAASPLNKEKCQALADQMNAEHDTDQYSARGFIGKAKTVDGVTYINAAKNVTKTGEPVERKPDIVSDICSMLDIETAESLEKAGKADLLALREAVSTFVSENA